MKNIKGGGGDYNTNENTDVDNITPTPVDAQNKGSFAVSGKSEA